MTKELAMLPKDMNVIVKKVLCVFIAPMTYLETTTVANRLYPARNWGNDIDNFLESYIKWPAGCEHTLLVVYKEPTDKIDPHETESTKQKRTGAHRLAAVPHLSVTHINKGFDIGSYVEVAHSALASKYEYLMFIGSTNILNSEGWLIKLLRPFETDPLTGLIGVCGSYGKGAWLPYPNPHIRTFCFLIKRNTFLLCGFKPVCNKPEGCALEHGPHSLTLTIHRLGLKCFVVGKSGNVYPPLLWNHPGGFADIHNKGSEMLATDYHARLSFSDQIAANFVWSKAPYSRDNISTYAYCPSTTIASPSMN